MNASDILNNDYVQSLNISKFNCTHLTTLQLNMSFERDMF